MRPRSPLWLHPCLYIFNRENPQNSDPQNGPRRGLDFIALAETTESVNMGHALFSVLLRAHFSAALHIGQVKAQDILSE